MVGSRMIREGGEVMSYRIFSLGGSNVTFFKGAEISVAKGAEGAEDGVVKGAEGAEESVAKGAEEGVAKGAVGAITIDSI